MTVAFRTLLTTGAAVLVALAVTTSAQAQNTCDSGKLKCMRKKADCLFKVHEKAVKKGLPPDAIATQKCFDKFDGGAEPAKGCIAKVEAKQKSAKPASVCTLTGDTLSLQELIDAFVAAAVVAVGTTPLPTPTPTLTPTPTSTPTPMPPCAGIIPDQTTGEGCEAGGCPAGEGCVGVLDFLTSEWRCGCASEPVCIDTDTCGVGGCPGTGCPAPASCIDACFFGFGCGCIENF